MLESKEMLKTVNEDSDESPEKTKTELDKTKAGDEDEIELPKKTANQQIDEISKLDDRDPIRKLQQYFKDSHYGHEYAEDGTRLEKRYKAPKHKNFIMQRYESQRQRGLDRNQRLLSQ